MEAWFIASIVAVVVAGFSNFFFKVVAKQGYSSEMFMLLSAACSVFCAFVSLLLYPQELFPNVGLALVIFASGFLSAASGVMKVYALRHIDSTIFFPLQKLLGPLLAIVAGVILFGELFSGVEWLGMALGLMVPLMLITKSENGRQNNLFLGLILVLATGVLSAIVAIGNNYAVDWGVPIFSTLLHTVSGIFFGSLALFIYKQGVSGLRQSFVDNFSWQLLTVSCLRSICVFSSIALVLYAYTAGGTLAIVQTIYSMYILIPIVLAIIFYNEHWNLQKAAAIVLSVVSLAFLG